MQVKSINEYIGAEMMTRLRVVAFNAIASDNFDGYIFGLLGTAKMSLNPDSKNSDSKARDIRGNSEVSLI